MHTVPVYKVDTHIQQHKVTKETCHTAELSRLTVTVVDTLCRAGVILARVVRSKSSFTQECLQDTLQRLISHLFIVHTC